MADQSSSGPPAKRLKTDSKSYDPRLLASGAINHMEFENAVSGIPGFPHVASGTPEPFIPAPFAGYQIRANPSSTASGTSASRHISPRDIRKFSSSYSPDSQDDSPGVSGSGTIRQHHAQHLENTFISPRKLKGPGSSHRNLIEEDNTSQHRAMSRGQNSRSPRERHLSSDPSPLFGSLERRDYEGRRNSFPSAQTVQDRPGSRQPPSVLIPLQPSPPRKAFVRGNSAPQETADIPEGDVGYYDAGFPHSPLGARPNRIPYEDQPGWFTGSGMYEGLQAIFSKFSTSRTGRTGEEIRIPDDSSSLERSLSKEARRRPSVGLNFDPESERQFELDERDAAEGHSHTGAIGPLSSIGRNNPRPLTRGQNTPSRPVPRGPVIGMTRSYPNWLNSYAPGPTQNQRRERGEEAISESSSKSEGNRPAPLQSASSGSSVRQATEERKNQDKDNEGNESPKRGTGKGKGRDDANPPSTNAEEGENEENEENENPSGEANKPESRPTYKDGNVGEESLKRHFPRRSPFRGMKTWAGMEIKDEIENGAIKVDELRMLKSHPSFERPMRRDRIARKSIPPSRRAEPATTASASKKSRQGAQRKDTKAAPPVRRNPIRTARLKK